MKRQSVEEMLDQVSKELENAVPKCARFDSYFLALENLASAAVVTEAESHVQWQGVKGAP